MKFFTKPFCSRSNRACNINLSRVLQILQQCELVSMTVWPLFQQNCNGSNEMKKRNYNRKTTKNLNRSKQNLVFERSNKLIKCLYFLELPEENFRGEQPRSPVHRLHTFSPTNSSIPLCKTHHDKHNHIQYRKYFGVHLEGSAAS